MSISKFYNGRGTSRESLKPIHIRGVDDFFLSIRWFFFSPIKRPPSSFFSQSYMPHIQAAAAQCWLRCWWLWTMHVFVFFDGVHIILQFLYLVIGLHRIVCLYLFEDTRFWILGIKSWADFKYCNAYIYVVQFSSPWSQSSSTVNGVIFGRCKYS